MDLPTAVLHGMDGAPRGHAPGPTGLPELWLYVRRHPALQLVVKVFDPTRHWDKPHSPDHDSEHGRGLTVIEGLSAERGFHLSRSRLGRSPTPGKVAWAAMPLPPT